MSISRDFGDAVVPKHNEVPIRRNPSPLNPLALNEREGRAYRFFQLVGAPALSSGFECEFWGRLVLQLANAENAIFHATVALGLLLEDMHNWPISWPVPRQAPPTERTANALRHYQTALQQLFVPVVGKESANAISLASAVVFACIETLCGNARNAMKLISSGISILTQLEASITSLANLENFAPFVSVFVRLDSYMRELLQTEHHVRPKPPVFRHIRPCPPVFGSLREANRQLEILENLCLFGVEQQEKPREVQNLLCDVGIQAQEEPQYTFYAVPVVEMANWKGCLPRGSWSASWKLKKMG
ncbi:Aspercryptin biosynthesis cluster-specific transcription regulator atnN [Colletotrichum fructicola]|nr:Aspercryptin biosynthesis cluster-specific transcription regulator atnN [Colletotrichum fructicola]